MKGICVMSSPSYPTSDLGDLKAQLDLARVCAYLDIALEEQSDGRWLGNCPFHSDTNPSFAVFPSEDGTQLCGCWSCSWNEDEHAKDPTRGDLFDLLRAYYKCGFSEAVAKAGELAESGDLPAPPPPRPRESITPEQVQFVSGVEGKRLGALDQLLAARGIAVGDRDWLAREFRLGGTEDGAVVIPHYAANGELAAFKTRAAWNNWTPMAARGSRLAELYGAWRDKGRRQVVLCEGESDTWSVSWWLRGEKVDVLGLPSGVSSAVRKEWVELLREREVTLLFDGDEAGRDGASKWRRALSTARVATLPDGEDATSSGEDAVKRAIETADAANAMVPKQPNMAMVFNAGRPERDFSHLVEAAESEVKDRAHAAKLALFGGRHLAYVPNDGWWICDAETMLWRPDPEALDVHELLHGTAGDLSTKNLLAAERQARSLLKVNPAEFVEHPYAIGLASTPGNPRMTLSLVSNDERPAKPEDFCHGPINATSTKGSYGPWDWLVKHLFPDLGIRDWVQRFFGYCVTGDADEQKALQLVGPPDTGKSTFVDAIRGTLGQYATTLSADVILTGNHYETARHEAALAGKRLAHINEPPRTGRMDEGRFKSHVSPGHMKVRKLRREEREVPITWKLVITSNHMLSMDQPDAAVWKRMAVVPVTVPLPKDSDEWIRDPDTGYHLPLAQLLATPDARNAILAWMLEGLHKQRERQLSEAPAQLHEAREAYKEQEDVLADFLAFAVVEDPAGAIPTRELSECFLSFARNDPELRQVSTRTFAKLLRERGWAPAKNQRVDGKPTKCWTGWRLVLGNTGNSSGNSQSGL